MTLRNEMGVMRLLTLRNEMGVMRLLTRVASQCQSPRLLSVGMNGDEQDRQRGLTGIPMRNSMKVKW